MQDKLHIVQQNYKLGRTDRNKLNKHNSLVIWFTGLSGSGKSTLANQLEVYLFEQGFRTYVLDGDNVRGGLNKDLDFSEAGREENIRRLGEVAKLFVDAGVIVLTAFISPFKNDREKVRQIVGDESFVEVFVDCPIEVCEQRDVKGLYKKARAGEIKNFTGIDSPFEVPTQPDVHVQTHLHSLEACLKQLINSIETKIKR